ncbi:hypothetical protein [Cuneatibacter caecimuris]|uniref:Uncharacterized protein n=1 Tax=Cuneatibacter caecimuris TaxID=1796618 RepID=A0A4Q7PKF4_9FIRM|nr:hypothetical protein [Cuneatibacter caecimuris]RZT01166.1 hypothetical protein EV209_1608 [Cuneatibacter caecimuris]
MEKFIISVGEKRETAVQKLYFIGTLLHKEDVRKLLTQIDSGKSNVQNDLDYVILS